jgi:arylsulfatase B
MKQVFRVIIVLAVLLNAAVFAESTQKPNILIIVADDLGYADVGFNGGKVIPTPNLDRLAATGVNLTDFRSCPMCSPTRAGLLTGRWPARFGMMRAVVPPWSSYGLPPEEQTMPDLLAAAGYEQRGIVGKWHLGHAKQKYLPLSQGFTRFYGHYNGAIDYFSHLREDEVDWHHDGKTVKEEGYATDLLGSEAVRFVKAAPAGKPWFLYVPFNAPHSPFQAKPSDLKKYEHLKDPDRRAYAAMVDCMDQAIGRILSAVESRSDADNTFILFFSDNGGIRKVGGNNGEFRGEKLTVYEGGTRVCAAARWPKGGLQGGSRFAERIGYIDVLPTVLSAAGAALPGNLDGINFLPAIRGEKPIPERAWFTYMHQNKERRASVHRGPWKLVAEGDLFSEKPVKAPKLELYNMAVDAAESNDVAAKHPERVAALAKELREFGKLEKSGVGGYDEGREGFKAPKDWVIFD